MALSHKHMNKQELLRKHPILGSSADPQKIALTWKGIAIGLVPAIIIILQLFGLEVVEGDLVELIETIFMVASAIITFLGLFRKLLNKYF